MLFVYLYFSYGDLARPQPGAQGRIRADRLWQELSDILNSVGGGVHKSTDKWKKVPTYICTIKLYQAYIIGVIIFTI